MLFKAMLQDNFDGKKSCSKMAKFLHKLWLFFFYSQQWHPLFSFSFFLCWHKNKKGKIQLHECWYNSFFICPSEPYTVVLLSCFPSGFTSSILQARDNIMLIYVSTKYMNSLAHTQYSPLPCLTLHSLRLHLLIRCLDMIFTELAMLPDKN